MNRILSPPPRPMTRAMQRSVTAIRCASIAIALYGTVLASMAVAKGAPIPFAILGVIALVIAVVVRRSGERRLELWLNGVERTAEARLGKQCTLTWCVEGRTYTGRTSPQALLWVDGRVRILVDPAEPSRMTPVGLEMILQPEPMDPPASVPTVLPSRPRADNPRVLKTARTQRIAAAVSAVIALIVACSVAPWVLERRRFLQEAAEVGPARVVGRTSSSVRYEFEGVCRTFEARGKAQARWMVGAGVRLYRHQGFLVAEPEVPGMPLALGLLLTGLPVAAASGMLLASILEARLARMLWRWGKEAAGDIVSDRNHQGRREVICRYSTAGKNGIARRDFSARRQPMEGRRGEAVVLVDPRDPRVSRIVLADEP